MEFQCTRKITDFNPESKSWSYERIFRISGRLSRGGIEPLTLSDITNSPDSYRVGATYVLFEKMRRTDNPEEADPRLLTREELKDYLEEPASTKYCWWCKNQGVYQCPHHSEKAIEND